MIRQAAAWDEAVIVACARHAYARYIPLIGREPVPMTADYRALIAAGEVYVAADDRGEVLGFVVFRPDRDAMLLENVAVFPAAAGKGVGKRLIGFCEEMAGRHGLAAVRLYTNVKMSENLGLYRKLGYAEVARGTWLQSRLFREADRLIRRPAPRCRSRGRRGGTARNSGDACGRLVRARRWPAGAPASRSPCGSRIHNADELRSTASSSRRA